MRVIKYGSGLKMTASKDLDAHLLYVEGFGLFNPIVDCSGDGDHG